jgi:hypothetical protein
MPGKITKNFRLHSAEQFYEQFDEAAPSRIYFFLARSNPWDNENSPPEPLDTTNETVYNVWDNMLALKRITPSDVSYGVDRVDWTSGTVYDQYTSDTEFFSNNRFYVITEDFYVYKCIYNNGGVPSTVKPTGRSTSNLTTGDGYVWKYMYTVTAADALKFSTTKIIPTKVLASDDGSDQWAVQQAAVNGSLSSILVTTGGSNYKEHSGAIVLGGTTTARLQPTANSTNNIYNFSTVYIASGTGAGQIRSIVDYDGATKQITVSPAFSPAVDTSSTYIVSPTVNISGDGTGAKAISRVSGGQISKINVIVPGSNYTRVTGTVTANTGSGATIDAQVSPVGGHGKDAVSELFAHNIIMNVKMTGSESNTFFIANDFRTVGLIVDPVELVANTVATDTTYDQTTRLTLDNPSLTFTADEVVTGGTSGATAYSVEYHSNTVLMVTGNVTLFANNETITGGTSGATATVVGITKPDLKKYQGKLLYIENRSPISRSSDQQEDVKIIVKF